MLSAPAGRLTSRSKSIRLLLAKDDDGKSKRRRRARDRRDGAAKPLRPVEVDSEPFIACRLLRKGRAGNIGIGPARRVTFLNLDIESGRSSRNGADVQRGKTGRRPAVHKVDGGAVRSRSQGLRLDRVRAIRRDDIVLKVINVRHKKTPLRLAPWFEWRRRSEDGRRRTISYKDSSRVSVNTTLSSC